MTDPLITSLRALAVRLQEVVHYKAVHANAMFSSEHWKHNAGKDWPETPDDNSYEVFENCVHPDCVLARTPLAALLAAHGAATPQEAVCDVSSAGYSGIVPSGITTAQGSVVAANHQEVDRASEITPTDLIEVLAISVSTEPSK